MSKKLKVLALVLVAVLTLSVFAGCGKKEVQGSSSVMTESEVITDTDYENENTDESAVETESEVEAESETEKEEDKEEDKDNNKNDKEDDKNTSSKKDKDKNTSSKKDKNTSSKKDKDTSSKKDEKDEDEKDNSSKESSSKSSGGKKPGQTAVDCSAPGEWPIVKNKITVEIMGLMLPSRGDPEKMSQFKYMEEISNIKTKYIGVEEGKYSERKALVLSSKDMPDMITASSWDDVAISKYTSGKKPKLVNVEPYLEKWAPNIKAVFDTDAVARGLNTTADGEIYTLPGLTYKTDNYDHWLNIRTDWLEEVGMDIPTTPEEFLEVMEAFRDQKPGGDETMPFAISNWSANFAMSWWGVKTTAGSIGIDRSYKVYYPYATKNARAAAIFWHDFHENEGLMDTSLPGHPEGYWAKFCAAIATGNVGCFLWSYLQGGAFSPELLKNYVAIPFPVANFQNSELNVSASSQPFNNTPSRGGEVITSSCENVPAMLRYWDYLYTEEGVMLGNFGSPKDGNYKKNKDGTYTITNKNLLAADAYYEEAMGWAMGINEVKKVFPNLIKRDTSSADYNNKVYDKYNAAALKTYADANRKYPTYYLPAVQKTAEEIAGLNQFKDAGFDLAHGCMQSYISGYWKIADFDNKVDGWNKKGLQQYIALYQKIVDRNRDNLLDSATFTNTK